MERLVFSIQAHVYVSNPSHNYYIAIPANCRFFTVCLVDFYGAGSAMVRNMLNDTSVSFH
jgi:hypothetical protein